MSRAEIDRAEHAGGSRNTAWLRPRDAATLIVLDGSGDRTRVLMGRRSKRHVFMPGKFVFPGGRTDPTDARIAPAAGLHPLEQAKMAAGGTSHVRAKAIALSAVREAYEEAGLLIGRKSAFSTSAEAWRPFSRHGVAPALDTLRLVARAITPPGQVRRFDTRFFAVWRTDVALELSDGGPSSELEELVWIELSEAAESDVPSITRTILHELAARLDADRTLKPGGPVPFFRMVRTLYKRDLL